MLIRKKNKVCHSLNVNLFGKYLSVEWKAIEYSNQWIDSVIRNTWDPLIKEAGKQDQFEIIDNEANAMK